MKKWGILILTLLLLMGISVPVYAAGEDADSTEETITSPGTTISSLTSKNKGFKVTWAKVKKDTDGYQIQVATNKGFTKNKATKTVTKNTTTSKSITGLKVSTTYYVRIRTYQTVDSKKYYSSWSSAKSIKTNKGSFVKKSGKKYYKYQDGKKAKSTFLTINKKTYYFDKKGVAKTGWMKKGGNYYYFDRSTGVQKKNCKVNGIKIKKDGTVKKTNFNVTKIKTMIKARDYLYSSSYVNAKYTDSKSKKLKKAFNWVLKHPYTQYRTLKSARKKSTWMMTFANDEFNKGRGCCVSEACAFAFLADEAGYTAYVCDDGEHAWTQINGKVYDTLFAESKSYKRYYGSTYKTAKLWVKHKTKI